MRVIEIGQILAGPFCGQLLADFGADVIKIEEPGVGDPMREWGREKPHGQSLWWPVVARNKKSITLDLRREEARDIVYALVREADILVENFKPGTLERWGLGYDVLSRINPRLIMVRITGYGQTGPYSHYPGYGAIGEALGGLRYVTGDPSVPPSRSGISIGDSLAAVFGCIGCLVALHARERTGIGQVVDSAIYESVLAMMESLIPEYDLANYVRERTGPILPNVAPSNVYPTSDGQMVLIAANQDNVFERLTRAMGQRELARDYRFETHSARGANQAALDQLIAAWTRTQTRDALVATLNEADVPVGSIYRAPEMLADPHFKAREAIIAIAHPLLGQIKMQNVVPKLSQTPGAIDHPGPVLGEHNDEIYRDLLGMSEATLADLKAKGVI